VTALRYRALDAALASGAVPDWALRAGSRYGIGLRERRESAGGVEAIEQRFATLLQRMRSGPIAEGTAEANEQHYELPSEFLGLFLGPRRKYSCCWFGPGVNSLAEAEEAMLALCCERAEVAEGMRILDLGCGWGSLSLWLAEKYPSAEIVGVSNSHGQRRYIESVRDAMGLFNLTIVTADVNEFVPEGRFDRVMSIEMFEHMRNWQELLRRIAGWLEDDGRLFVHVFSHRTLPYRFEDTWAADRFFTAGLMPSHELIAHFQDDMRLERRWAVPGTHYADTLVAWLRRLDEHGDQALAMLRDVAGGNERRARALLGGWRLFLLSTDEIWRSGGGNQWMVSHYLMSPRGPR
jgi:cyclopropane-fatty-acyl-phospholipid synthase